MEWLVARYPDQSTEVALRYLPVVRYLREAGASKVLEVGSGDLGLTPYSDEFELTGLDTAFGNPNESMRQVTGAVDRLPFEDRTFDAVISVDSLERLAPDDRENAVTEILRTALRRAVIAVPSGAGAEAQDRALDERYRRLKGKENPFLHERLDNPLPEKEELEQMLTRSLRRLGRTGSFSLHKNANLRLRSFLMKGWMSDSRFYRNLGAVGLLPFAGMLSKLNLGRCYRIIAVIDLAD